MPHHILKNENTILLGLLKKLEEIKQLNILLATHLEPELASHCHVVKLEKNCLFVITENGNWATRLRFHIPSLMKVLRSYTILENLNGIICKISPALTTYKTRTSIHKQKPPFLTPQTAQNIQNSAKNISDLKLRGILEKIASHLILPEE